MFSRTVLQVIAIGIVTIILYYWRKMQKHYQIANKIPGPKTIPILGNFMAAKKVNFEPLRLLRELYKYHGDSGIVRFLTGMELTISISHPSDIQNFFTNNALRERSSQYKHLEEWFGKGGLLTSVGDVWKRARKMKTETFHIIPPDSMVSAMTLESDDLLEKFKEFEGKGFIKVMPHLKHYADGITTRVALDETISENGEVADTLTITDELTVLTTLRIMSPLHYYNWMFHLTKEGYRFRKLRNRLRLTIKKLVERKKCEYEELIRANKPIPPSYVNNYLQKYGEDRFEELPIHLITLYVTAADTTSSTIGFILTMLGMHPDVQEKVYEEDKEIQSQIQGRQLLASDLLKYEYLDTVVKETMRLYPVVPMIGREASKDVQIGKYLIPKGSNVCSITMWTNRREDLYTDALKFQPSRFSKENGSVSQPYLFLPFSTGDKKCAGQTFAMMSLKMITAKIIRHYKIVSMYGSIAELDENLSWSFTLQDDEKVPLKFISRNN